MVIHAMRVSIREQDLSQYHNVQNTMRNYKKIDESGDQIMYSSWDFFISNDK